VNPFAPVQPVQGLWSAVGKLLYLRLLIVTRGFRRARRRRKIWLIFTGLVVLAFMGFLAFVSWQILRFMQRPELAQAAGDFNRLLEAVPVLMMSGAFLGIFLTSFGVLLQALYLSGDMDFLLATPVPIRAVFIAKLLQAVLPNFTLLCLFSLPMLYGLGAAYGYTPLFYPLALVMMSALALAAAGLSALLVMAVVRVFPARRVAEVIGFVGAIFSLLCSQTGNLAQYSDVSRNQAMQAMSLLQRVDTPWSPFAWAGRGLTAIGEGRWLAGLGLSGLILVLSGGIFFVSLATAERLYYSGWASLQNQGRKRKVRPPARTAGSPSTAAAIRRTLAAPGLRLVGLIPAPIRALIGKDWLVLRRDLKNLSQLVTPMIFGIIYAFMLLRDQSKTPFDPDLPPWANLILQDARIYGGVALALFVGWMLLSRLAGMGFSQEGRSYWLLKTAPLSVGQLILAKYLVAYLPAAGLSLLYLGGVWLLGGGGLQAGLYALLATALAVAGCTGLNLAFGIVGANLTWEDPRQMQKTASSCLGAFITMIFMPIVLGLFLAPPVLFRIFDLPVILGQAAGLAMGSGLSLIAAILPPALARKRIERLGEG